MVEEIFDVLTRFDNASVEKLGVEKGIRKSLKRALAETLHNELLSALWTGSELI